MTKDIKRDRKQSLDELTELSEELGLYNASVEADDMYEFPEFEYMLGRLTSECQEDVQISLYKRIDDRTVIIDVYDRLADKHFYMGDSLPRNESVENRYDEYYRIYLRFKRGKVYE